jgi:hypothetical protein
MMKSLSLREVFVFLNQSNDPLGPRVINTLIASIIAFRIALFIGMYDYLNVVTNYYKTNITSGMNPFIDLFIYLIIVFFMVILFFLPPYALVILFIKAGLPFFGKHMKKLQTLITKHE